MNGISLFVLRSREANPMYQALLKKTIIRVGQMNCLKYLMKYKNVTCVMPLEAAKLYIKECRVEYNFREMKIDKEYFQKYTTGINFEPGSPFGKGIDRTLDKLTDSDLIKKCTENYAPIDAAEQVEYNDGGSRSSTILILMLTVVLAVGLRIYLFLFLCELLIGRRNFIVEI